VTRAAARVGERRSADGRVLCSVSESTWVGLTLMGARDVGSGCGRGRLGGRVGGVLKFGSSGRSDERRGRRERLAFFGGVPTESGSSKSSFLRTVPVST
jgi:hypothetical protein